jgi:hypothetical protein
MTPLIPLLWRGQGVVSSGGTYHIRQYLNITEITNCCHQSLLSEQCTQRVIKKPPPAPSTGGEFFCAMHINWGKRTSMNINALPEHVISSGVLAPQTAGNDASNSPPVEGAGGGFFWKYFSYTYIKYIIKLHK